MYNLLTWDREPFNGGVSYIADCGGFVVTANYSASNPLEFESDAKSWELFDNAGYMIKSFSTLEQAQRHAEYLYENKE